MKEPTTIVAGNSYSWTREWSDFPATEYTLQYVYTNQQHTFSVNGTPNGAAFDVTIAPATSSTWNAGNYTWLALLTKAGERITGDNGTARVLPDPASAPVDYRSQLERILADLWSAYERMGQKGAMEAAVNMGERSVTFRNKAEVWAEIQRIQIEIKREKVAAGLKVPGTTRIRFV